MLLNFVVCVAICLVNMTVLHCTCHLLVLCRSPLNPGDDRNDDDSNLSGGGGGGSGGGGSKDRSRERERDRSRRGDRPSRFGPRSSSHSRERERDRERDRVRDRGEKKSAAERRVFVSNIAYEYHWQELKDLFRKEGMFLHVFSAHFDDNITSRL